MTPSLAFDGEVVVVTGGGHGMGRAHSVELAARGACVAVVDVDEPAALDVVGEIARRGGAGLAIGVSGEATSLAGVVERTLDHTGRIDAIVNNAGIAHERQLSDEQAVELDRLLDVHLRSPFHLVRSAWHELVRRRGRVVNVASNSALFGKAGMSSYAGSKGALVGWTRSLALEGAAAGVRVNAVAPIAATRMTSGILGDLERHLTPERVTPVVVWLAHRDCPENGSVISAAGGAVARVVAARIPAGVASTPEDVRDLLAAPIDLSSATLPASAAGEVVDVRADLAVLASTDTNTEVPT